MAKGPGSTRTSRWPKAVVGSNDGEIEDLYFRDGRRVEYDELSTAKKKLVKGEKKRIFKELYQKLQNTATPQVIDNNERIEIYYTSKGLDHFCNDAMLTLSGKYFSRASMMKIDEILKKSTYLPGPHGLTHPRTDGRDLWFSYQDADGRSVYFKVDWNKKLKKYELYSVVDSI